MIPWLSPIPAAAQVTLTQITTSSTGGTSYGPSINSDGTRIAFSSSSNLTGGNADGYSELFLWTQGSGITQLTASDPSWNNSPSINSDGTRIAFLSSNDLTPGSPGNSDGFPELFLWTQGVDFTQITNTTVTGAGQGYSVPSITADGTRIAFGSTFDLTPGNPGNQDRNMELFLWTQGVGFTQITNTAQGIGPYLSDPSISADGTQVAFRSDYNLTGGNPDGNYEIFLWTQGVGFTQITTTPWGSSHDSPFISSDGTRIVFSSSSDQTGDNPDGNKELFLWTQGSGITQLTTATFWGNWSEHPSINSDGTRIAFTSINDPTGGNPLRRYEIFLWTQGVGFTQITTSNPGMSNYPSINSDGTRIAFTSSSNLTPGNPGNPDGNGEIFLAERACVAPPSGMVSWWGGDWNAFDIIGANDGTLVNGATFAPGKVGQAFSFGGVNDYVEIPDNASLNPSGAFSVDGWFYIDPAAPENDGGVASLVAKTSGGVGDGGWFLWFQDTGGPYTNALRFDILTWGTGGIWPFAEVSNAITSAGWYHIAGVFDLIADPQARLYLNGVLVASSASTIGAILNNTFPVRIGASHWTDVYNPGNDRFEGMADEVEFFNRALTAEEIAAIANAGSAGKCQATDTTPDPFSFTDVTGVALNTLQTSNAITVSGITAPAAITVSGDASSEYQVNGGAWTSSPGTVANGNTVQVRHTSAATYSTSVDTTLTIGGVSDTFTSTTTVLTTHALIVAIAGSGSGSVSSSPPGIACPGDCTESYNSGTVVGLTATPATGSSFAGFSGDADCTDGSVTLGADKICTATFALTLTPTGPDLTGVWNHVSQRCRNGQCRLQGSVQVVNQGNATAPISLLRVILSDDAVLDPGDPVLKEMSTRSLRRGRTIRVRVLLSLGVNPSGKYLFAVIDPLNSVAETDESDNVVSVGPLP